MSPVCRICLEDNTSLISVKNKQLKSCYEKLTNAKFNSEDARPRALCCYCYQKLLRCHTFAQMAVRSEKIFNHLYDSGLEVAHEYISEVKLSMKQHLSVVIMPFMTIDVNASNVGSQGTIKDEPTDIGAKEVVTTEPDTLPEVESYPKDFLRNQLSFKENIIYRENDMEVLISKTIDLTKPDELTIIKDDPLSSIDVKEEITTELDKFVEVESFPEQTTESRLTFEELLHKIYAEHNKPDDSKKMPFSCNSCFKVFYMKSKLITHIRNSHSKPKRQLYSPTKKHTETTIMIEDKSTRNQKSKLICHVCDKTFNRKSWLVRHIRTHTGEKPFVCHVCKKRFSEKGALNTHMRIHTGEKPFVCHDCKKRFNDKSTLYKHMRIHTGVKPFSCHVCDKQFNLKYNLVGHVRIHTGEKPFACNVCDKKFIQKCNLVSHMRTHTGVKPQKKHKKITKKYKKI